MFFGFFILFSEASSMKISQMEEPPCPTAPVGELILCGSTLCRTWFDEIQGQLLQSGSVEQDSGAKFITCILDNCAGDLDTLNRAPRCTQCVLANALVNGLETFNICTGGAIRIGMPDDDDYPEYGGYDDDLPDNDD